MREQDKDLAETTGLVLTAGRLLYANGAETETVANCVEQFGQKLGLTETRCAITYEHMMVTAFRGSEFRTRIGRHTPGMAVNMALVTALKACLEAGDGERLLALEKSVASWRSGAIVLLVGLTAASLSHLFGGDWAAFLICQLAGSLGMTLRIWLGRRHTNAFLTAFLAALASGLVGGWLARFSLTPEMCLIAPAMVIVPGVPLVNSVLDLVRNHISLGLARIAQGGVTLIAISLGLALASWATGAQFPVNLTTATPPLAQVAFFAALSALGYAALFNVPYAMVWGCLVCGGLSFTTRVILLGQGVSLSLATLLASLAVGILSLSLARHWKAPPAVFAYPGIVAMVPGAFAFRAVSGLLQWVAAGPNTPVEVALATGALIANVLLLVGAIALGIALPALLRPR